MNQKTLAALVEANNKDVESAALQYTDALAHRSGRRADGSEIYRCSQSTRADLIAALELRDLLTRDYVRRYEA